MSYKIYISENFDKNIKRLAKKYPSIKTDIIAFSDSLTKNPTQGISLGKDCYKVRMAISSKGKGKSGGSRIITCVKIVSTSIFLLSIYDKSEKESLDENELDNLLKMIHI